MKCTCHSHNGLVLSPEGLAQRENVRDGLDNMESSLYLDRVGSVSADGHGPGHPRDSMFEKALGLSDRELQQLEMFDGS